MEKMVVKRRVRREADIRGHLLGDSEKNAAKVAPSPQPTNTSADFEDQFLWDATVLMGLGYRYQKPEGGFFFRIAYTPGAYFIKTLWTFIQ